MVTVRVETKEAAPVSGKPWTRHYDPDVPASLVYPSVPLQAMLDDAAENHPNSTATIVVVLSRLYPVVKAARANTSVEHAIVTNIKEEMPPVLRVLFTLAKEKKDGHRQQFAGDPGAISMSQVLSAPSDPFDAGTGPDDIAVLQYTGGTTGVSKGA